MSESAPNPDDRRERLERIARERPEPPVEPDAPSTMAGPVALPRHHYPDTNVFITAICGLIFLYVAWQYRSAVALGTPTAAYAASLRALPWLAGGCGVALLIAAALGAARLRFAVVVEFAAAVLATLTTLGVGVIWAMEGDSDGFFLLIFALINGHAALTCYRIWRRV